MSSDAASSSGEREKDGKNVNVGRFSTKLIGTAERALTPNFREHNHENKTNQLQKLQGGRMQGDVRRCVGKWSQIGGNMIIMLIGHCSFGLFMVVPLNDLEITLMFSVHCRF
jgi:hypothetical protein